MSETNNTIAINEIIREFLEEKPLGEFRLLDLNVNKIFNEVSISDVADRLINDQLKGFEIRKHLFLKVLDEVITEIKNICTHHQNANGSIKTMANSSQNSLPFGASAEDNIFMIYLEELYRQFEAILLETTAKKSRRCETADLVKSNSEKLEWKIEKLTNILKEAQRNFSEKIKPKLQALRCLKIEMSLMKSNCDDKINDFIYEGSIKVGEKTKIKLDTIKEVQRTLHDAEVVNEKDRAELSVEIRKLKEQKLKAEQALQTLYLKFDSDVGGRGGELTAIQEETKVTQKFFDVWTETVSKPQQIAYNQIMLLKQEEERQEDEQMVQELLQNHSARIIQKSWRKYLRRKKKEGKDKGKKKLK